MTKARQSPGPFNALCHQRWRDVKIKARSKPDHNPRSEYSALLIQLNSAMPSAFCTVRWVS